jgi:hypothetical protein
MDRAPGGYEAGIALKTGTAAALITDHERKTIAGRIPYLDLLDGVITRLNCTMRLESTPHAIKSRSCEGCLTAALPNRQIGRTFTARRCPLGPSLLDELDHQVDGGLAARR